MEYPKVFIEELRLQLNRHNEAQNSLNAKTNALLIISGITASIMLGFYSNIINEPNGNLYKDVIFIPFIFIIISILASLRIFAPRKSTYPITSSNYFDDDGCALVDKIKKRCEENIGDVTITAKNYLRSMRDIEKQNAFIGNTLIVGIFTYVVGIITWIIIIYAIQMISELPNTS